MSFRLAKLVDCRAYHTCDPPSHLHLHTALCSHMPCFLQQALRDKSNELEIKIDKEINALKAAVELTKNETIK